MIQSREQRAADQPRTGWLESVRSRAGACNAESYPPRTPGLLTRLSGARLASMLGVLLSAVGLAESALAQAPTAPVAPHTITAFPARDFVSLSGYDEATSLDIQVFRQDPVTGQLVMTGNAPGLIPVAGVAEVNHPGASCWGLADGVGFVTPDIRGGDVVRVTYHFVDAQNQALAGVEEIVVDNATVTVPAYSPGAAAGYGPDVVLVHGTAAGADGVTPTPIAGFSIRVRAAGAGIFVASGKQDLDTAVVGSVEFDPIDPLLNPLGLNWTAVFSNLSAEDVALAVNGESMVQVLYLGGPSLTIHEGNSADPAGPAAGCNAYPGSPNAPPLDGSVAVASEAALYFTATPTGGQAARRVTLTNLGAGAFGQLHVTGYRFEPVTTDFSVVGSPCGVVAVGGTCVVDVVMSSLVAGEKNATLVITSDSLLGDVRIPLTGLVVAAGAPAQPYLIVRPTALDMGSRVVGNLSDAYTAQVVNLGSAPAPGLQVAIGGVHAAEFSLVAAASPCIGATLESGAGCAVSLLNLPLAVGARNGVLTVQATGFEQVVSANIQALGIDVTGVIEPPSILITTFPGREFVSVEGLAADATYTVQVMRHGEVVSQSTGLVPVNGLVEVNHPATPCWQGTTPDLRAGDRVRVVASSGTIYQSYVGDVGLFPNPTDPTTAVVQIDANTIELHGWARAEGGGQIPTSQIACELVSGTANKFEFTNRRAIGAPGDGTISYDPIDPVNNPDGTRWTARFTGLIGNDVVRAQTQSTQAALWLGRLLAGNETTINEFGAAVEPGCIPRAPEVVAPALEAPTGDTLLSQASLQFPPRTAGSAAVTRTLTIRNPGPGAVSVTGLPISGANASGFSVASVAVAGTTVPGTAFTLQSGQAAVVTVRFSAAGLPGIQTASLTISDNVAGVVTIPMTGEVVATAVSHLTATPAALSFPDTQVNDATILQVRVVNEGQLALPAAMTFGLTGPDADQFVFTANLANTAVLNPNAGRNLNIRYRPRRLGAATATATITYQRTAADPAIVLSIPLEGFSGLTAQGFSDPPVGRLIGAFYVRDFVSSSGFQTNEVVDVQVVRNGRVIGIASKIIPIDDPATVGFDGIVEVNHIGAACWDGAAPDIAPGDLIQAISYDINTLAEVNPTVLARNQTYVQDIELTSGVLQTGPGTVVVTGRGRDARTRQLLDLGALEVRIVSAGGKFAINGANTLRAPLSGSLVATAGDTFRATFTGLSAADVALALQSDAVALWLGRSPLAGVEATHVEWNEETGAQAPGCTPQVGAVLRFPGEPVRPAAVGFVGNSGVNTGLGATLVIPLTNLGNRATTITNLSIVGLDTADFQIISPANPGVLSVSLAAGASMNITVGVQATAAGLRQATLRVAHSGANNPEFYALQGRGLLPPTLTAITPSTGGVNTLVTLAGANFINVQSVLIGGQAATGLTVLSETSLQVRVPNLSYSGVAAQNVKDVQVTTAAGSATLAGAFTLLPNPPGITSLTLPAAPVLAGKVITVNGTNLSFVTSVTLGGITLARDTATVAPTAPRGFRIEANGTLSVTIPNGAPASSQIRVISPGGEALSTTFTVVQPPRFTIASVASARPGTVVTFTGTDLGLITGTAVQSLTSVTFTGSAPLTTFTRVSATSIRLTIPANAQPGPILLTGPAGTSQFTGLTVLAVPTVTQIVGVATASGTNQTAIGQRITIRGASFVGVTRVTVGGIAATAITTVSATELTVTVAAGTPAGAQRVAVTTAGGTGTSAAAVTVTVVPVPGTPTFTPLTGSITAGTTITVSGTNLQYVNSLFVGTTQVPFTRVGTGATQRLTFRTVAGLAGAIRVQTLAGSATSAQAFRATP